MLNLNKYQDTKEGEKVMPIAILGDVVQCVDMTGNVVMRNISDFPEEQAKQEREKIIEVSPDEEKNTDILLDKNETEMLQYEGELFPEEKEEKKVEKPKPKKNKKQKNRYISDEEYI